ncbi:EAL domain-containing protein [Rhodoferax saidenbachensis]|uniref:EAL domain-containing protein (Putative c-di-GMP-specific phosphodiesterase class I) n=1 Tax=Rhodoferax saidenbachensis TaxID=1484693 RepID=A0ABU1ZR24_9BURK|nr:EAL domain-containing protein [Rhodoferax saidenbachensis]MDR7307406.1 EAL domain-containing protein (putative c-di-GMP-specific phosphodiesterase class I) [Rhodoferax saidenbachensis]
MATWCTPQQTPPLVGTRAGGEVVAHHGAWVLYSVFQPIYAAGHAQPAAFEALIRAHDMHTGREVPLSELFHRPANRDDGVLLDRLCRLLHVLNFQRQSHDDTLLYLNLDAGYLQSLRPGLHGQFFSALQAEVPHDPAKIILEITETEIESRDVLAGIVDSFKQRGFRVAIDDFGARHSNFDRLWGLTPDIVKIDRELLLQAEINPRAGKIFPKLIDIIHDLAAQVVCEGIETPAQQALAVRCQADFLQGYLFARPDRTLQS